MILTTLVTLSNTLNTSGARRTQSV